MNSCMFSGNAGPSSSCCATQHGYVPEQFSVQQQQCHIRNDGCQFNFSIQTDMMSQNNVGMISEPVMPQPPPVYEYDQQLTGYPPISGPNVLPQYQVNSPMLDPRGSRPKPNPAKRIRTQYTSQQLIQLDEAFARNRYLCRANRIKLSQDLTLTEKQIKVWFQNRRMKFKKENTGTRYRHSTSSRSSPVSSNSPNVDDVRSQVQRPAQRFQNTSSFHMPSHTLTSNSAFHPTVPTQFSTAYSSSSQGVSLSDLYLRESGFISELNNPPILLDESYSIARVNEIQSPLYAGFTGNNQMYDGKPEGSDSSPDQNGLMQL